MGAGASAIDDDEVDHDELSLFGEVSKSSSADMVSRSSLIDGYINLGWVDTDALASHYIADAASASRSVDHNKAFRSLGGNTANQVTKIAVGMVQAWVAPKLINVAVESATMAIGLPLRLDKRLF